MSLSPRHLRAFLALAEHKSFTKAAAQVHRSQPAFSALIRSLEEITEVRLFERSTRKVSLTPEGIRFEQAAKKLLADFDEFVATFSKSENRHTKVSLAAMPSLAARILPPQLMEFRQQNPNVNVELIDALPEECLRMLRDSQVDFALTTVGMLSPEFSTRPYCSDEFYLVCPRGHPLAESDKVDLHDLLEYPFIHYAHATRLRQQIDAAIYPKKMRTLMEIERVESVRGLVESGAGISLAPSLTLFHFESEKLCTVPLKRPGLHRQMLLVWLSNKPLAGPAKDLADQIVGKPPLIQTPTK